MADDDFEIDIYGDAEENGSKAQEQGNQSYSNNSAITVANGSNNSTSQVEQHGSYEHDAQDQHDMDVHEDSNNTTAHQQGVKRKEAPDDRPVDPGATSALLVGDLPWWSTDDDIRGMARQADCESELRDITFSEHKVNGKSKGQAYIEFASQQAATAVKHEIEQTGENNATKKHTVTYTNPNNNPYRTLPKDGPTRANKDGPTRGGPMAGGYNDRGGGNFGGGFRGRGGGGFGGPRGGGGFNRNFGGNNMGGGGGFNNPMGGGGGGFNNGMGGGFNMGFNNRGGGMMGGGMRGGGMRGRGGGMGGINNGMMGGMMGGMPAMGMQMGGMPGGMGMGFPQQPHFNPTFFGNNQPQQMQQPQQSDWQNPHGAKRPRPE
ncbi:hypothetical protein Micbo1qcDRAFT_158622 [Microdochium bolleyi]|uniref:RRM domain-containing protein n=1 Tax=Microdochium bolleyi TaxID=196109 RepID=A0A136J9J4_9PEZI|nr:hypothetical protein Micbo1qcDRAFT_158622 [Microdochium bolleyi]